MILRPATPYDKEFFYTIRSDAHTARMSRRGMISRADHDRWWEKTSDHRFIADADGGPVGTIRISSEGVVSIVVAPGLRGQGYGASMLALIKPIARSLGYERLWGDIAWENIGSQKAFLKAGWRGIVMETSV